MAGWSTDKGMAVCLPQANIDTDQLIPARFMSVPRAHGYGRFLLHDMRREEMGDLKADFPLNAQEGISVLVAGRNFGSGSSREAAVYALVDSGIRAVFAPSFGDIFASNAVNNGLLPAQIDKATYETLSQSLERGPQSITIDLGARSLQLGSVEARFSIDDSWALKLMNGWDDIDLTRHHRTAIAVFKNIRHQTTAWAWPNGAD
jgi:3-isopropylmalate/(R)-2-methylmalate dehydratase small subunit